MIRTMHACELDGVSINSNAVRMKQNTYLDLMFALFIHLFLRFRPFFVILHFAHNRLYLDFRQRTCKVVVEGELIVRPDIA